MYQGQPYHYLNISHFNEWLLSEHTRCFICWNGLNHNRPSNSWDLSMNYTNDFRFSWRRVWRWLLWNVGQYLQDYTMLLPSRQPFSLFIVCWEFFLRFEPWICIPFFYLLIYLKKQVDGIRYSSLLCIYLSSWELYHIGPHSA
jgi:hypothetical protein